ncbi:unnamed protein product [Durusdinium trenchii]|uniref:Uncharacterized protein n=1 Tax=Durusdinium trenchii TaxID=1381693 RepID=A0ABP0PGC9_9DINO
MALSAEKLRCLQFHERQAAKREALEAKQRQTLMDFLEDNGFDPHDVNAAGTRNAAVPTSACWGRRLRWQRPLHKAALDGNMQVILLLVAYGADPMKKEFRSTNSCGSAAAF